MAPINLAPVATFAVYVIISVFWKNESLLTVQAFTSLALISLLTTPVIVFIQALPSVIQCIGCFDRIQEFCNYCPELQAQSTSNDSDTSDQRGLAISLRPLPISDYQLAQSLLHDDPLSYQGQSFRWTKQGPDVLESLSVAVERRRVTAVVGPVGCGKSSFLASILGEMFATTARPSRAMPPTAYCSQEPWLENGTIRQNIIGPATYDSKWYSSVAIGCGLEPDLVRLKKGNDTRVGSKGVNLSGGQKQRIALARAVYARPNLVLLDDVFSGMDAHTMATVSGRLLGPEGLLRKLQTTVVLATHSPLADTVIVLEGGKIIETGSPTILWQGSGYASKLVLRRLEDHTSADRISSASTEAGIHNPDVSTNLGDEDDQPPGDSRRKNGELSVYKYYLERSGYTVVGCYLGSMALWMFCTEFPTIWLMWWSEANNVRPNANVGMYMGIYAMLGILGVLSTSIAAWFAFIPMISNSAARLHWDLLETTINAPFRFFTTTDAGELLNRFSEDMQLIDMALPAVLVNYTSTAFSCALKVIIVLVFSRYLGAAVPIFATALYFLQRFYLQTFRQLRLLGIETKAPLYTHFTESVAGSTTIRAFGWEPQYEDRNCLLIDTSQRPAHMLDCLHYWLELVVNLLVGALSVVLVAVVVTWKEKFTGGSVGVSLVMIVGFNESLTRLITNWTDMESSIGAAARVKRFNADTPSEISLSRRTEPPSEWPRFGSLEFNHVVASYGPDASPALKDITVSIPSGQHVGICGRSGSGKTSLILCVLQMLDLQAGHIVIDGIDLATLSSDVIRQRVNVVPQDAFFLPGTVRLNLDPFDTVTDEDIISALRRVGLWDTVRDRGGLPGKMDSAAWSAGQKQLFCLARAMIKKSPILILDEAASSADRATEAIMQDIIDTEFKECTVLAVMHRLEHIERYDRVLLLDDGVLVEDGEPATLMAAAHSRFSRLSKAAGGEEIH
ncbi:hypothetical protein LTR65_005528 [Meristemomyces frigidus]